MRRTLGVLLAAGALAGAAAAPAQAEAGLDWQPCEQNAEVECSTVQVPLDWANPQGEQIDIAVARRPATDPARKIGTLVAMPGGPGGTGVSWLVGGSPFDPEIAARFDVVSYDPRGFGGSHQLQCDPALMEEMPDVRPDGPEQFEGLKDYNRRASDDCRARSGAIVDHMDTASVARDIDAFRAALGEQQLSLYGISYGTLTGQMYAEQFPGRVRSLVLDSVFDHSQDTSGFMVTQAEAAEDSFDEFAKWCDRDAACALHGEDVGAVYDELYKRAEAGELPQPGGTEPMTPVELSRGVIGAFYGPDWHSLATQLDEMRNDQPTTVAQQQNPVPNPTAAFCNDHRIEAESPEDYARLFEQQEQAAPHLRGGVGGALAPYCLDWKAPVQNPQHVPDIRTEAPVLILNALHDPATGYNWATNVDSQIERATMLTYDGWGHGVYTRSECTAKVTHDYLIDGAMPAEGAHCPAVEPGPAPTSVRPNMPW
ncbi:alpha/beta hydrolase [Saccharopolyspora dendranthemae]|uniref:Pimeloyl-ACP methyl ester carboxylesterase n=1 Tax=Saccharopolyspora dendranthemae TaxID=1181886 RepID=A0A561VAU5_9PSEU|nr:alpha/beta hydrolase [Saccharopolyspora dendranthemae]TWG08720.1 pimeloyl-ACP methyl ester carboxylesterase [Saccharopolyspora dendranthemae]